MSDNVHEVYDLEAEYAEQDAEHAREAAEAHPFADLDSRCPYCAEPIDYCQGHGEIGDPAGFAILAAHDNDEHDECHPEGCDDAPDRD